MLVDNLKMLINEANFAFRINRLGMAFTRYLIA
jgi:hypothetical protein